jgi:post-segregation antitoxin (ccd killing protein)
MTTAKLGIESEWSRRPKPRERAKQWAKGNSEAIAAYNRRIARRGLISDEFRTW